MKKKLLPSGTWLNFGRFLLSQIALVICCSGILYASPYLKPLEKVEIESTVVKSINGTVVDETNSALAGVSILVKGTSNGTVTDVDGKFSL